MKEKAEKADTFAEEAVAATLSGMPLTKVRSELIATPVMARKSPATSFLRRWAVRRRK